MGLLSQHVNFLGLTTAIKKLQAIKLLTYQETLGVLKYYFDLISYLCSYIHFYTQLLELLYFLKTRLLKSIPISN